MCVICCASGACNFPWRMAEVIDEVRDLARILKASFHHIPKSANEVADNRAKEEVAHQILFTSFENGSL